MDVCKKCGSGLHTRDESGDNHKFRRAVMGTKEWAKAHGKDVSSWQDGGSKHPKKNSIKR